MLKVDADPLRDGLLSSATPDESIHTGHGHEAPGCFDSGSVMSSAFILGCVSMGVGVFSFPAVFKLSGMLGGILLLASFAVVSAFAQKLALQASAAVNAKSYEECTTKTLGRFGLIWQIACLAIGPFIANCAHVQAVGSLLADSLIWFVDGTTEASGGAFHLPASRKAVLCTTGLRCSMCVCAYISALAHDIHPVDH